MVTIALVWWVDSTGMGMHTSLISFLLHALTLQKTSLTMVDLLDQITWPSVECLNAHPDHSLDNALKQVGRHGLL